MRAGGPTSRALESFTAEDRTQFCCVRCTHARKNNECTGAGSSSARPLLDNPSLSVIGTISITVVCFNSTIRSSRPMYQSNKRAVESMLATTIGCSNAAACTHAILGGIGNDPLDASSPGLDRSVGHYDNHRIGVCAGLSALRRRNPAMDGEFQSGAVAESGWIVIPGLSPNGNACEI
jgi:hypothetical protein